MSQAKVTSFFVPRRSSRNQNRKATNIEPIKSIAVEENNSKPISLQTNEEKHEELTEKIKVPTKSKVAPAEKQATKPKEVKQKTTKRGPKVSKKALSIDSSQSKVTSFYETEKESKALNLPAINEDNISNQETHAESVSSSTHEACKQSASVDITLNEKVSEEKEILKEDVQANIGQQNLLRSPKRNLVNPNEGTPPKKKTLLLSHEVASGKMMSPSKVMTPKKLFNDDQIGNESSEPTPEKKEIVVRNQSEETKKAIDKFKAKLALVRNYEKNSFKATSFVSPSLRQEKKEAPPTVPAYEKYSSLVDKEISSDLILPFKYKLLSEMFRSMDTVISILNNRKEKITFEKVKDGVQQMMKRTFSRVHLGQIMTVMPSAFDVTLEKCSFKKANDPDYQIIITPKLNVAEGSTKKSKSNRIVIVSPQDLSDRKQLFHNLLIDRVKQHHQVFLSRLNFPFVSADKIKRWHPKFAIDNVPDIEEAKLPEIPENKVYTAKDVLNKVVKSSLRGKVVKALKSVADESANADKKSEPEPSPSQTKTPQTKSALNGVCADLIAKIRARESAKLLETMIESPVEAKRKAMLERLPKIIQILWHYFIAERKAAVPVDTAVEKIVHSCSSLSTHEEVKAHLNLITETFPGWLSFIKIPKGLYITINKSKNITEMLDNFPHG